MNCRKVNHLLSAFVDEELTVDEMQSVRLHLEICPHCRLEAESLEETKRMVASLAFRAPRAELEKLLHVEAERAAQPTGARLLFPVTAWFGELRERSAVGGLPMRPSPVAATALLSLAGLWLASATVDRHNGPDLQALPNFATGMVSGNGMISGNVAHFDGTMFVGETPRNARSYTDRGFFPLPARHAASRSGERVYVPASVMPTQGPSAGASILFSVKNDVPVMQASFMR